MLNNSKNKDKKVILIWKIIIFVLILAIIFLLILIFTSNKSTDEDFYGNPNNVEIHNIVIEDFDEYGMGLLHENKYYQIQYGVHIKDKSLIGEQLGVTSIQNQLTSVDGTTYQYSENATYLVDDQSAFYKYNGPEDIILLDSGQVDDTINNMWVLSPTLLPKTSIYDFITSDEELSVVYYPQSDDFINSYIVENPDSFVSSFSRTSYPNANYVQEGYLTIDDNSGLLYGLVVYYDYDTGFCFLNPPTYPKLFFEGNDQLGSYLTSYLSSLYAE